MTIKQRALTLKKRFRLKIDQAKAYSRAYSAFLTIVGQKITGLFSNNKVIVIALYEHIGDIISCEPVIEYIRQNNGNAKIFWAVKKDYAELLECHPQLSGLIRLHFFYDWILLRRLLLLTGTDENSLVDLHINGKACTAFKKKLHKKNAVLNFNDYLTGRSQLEAFTISAGLPALSRQPVFYLNPAKHFTPVVSPYIVFHTQSNMQMKDWNVDDWKCLCLFCMQAGFYVVEVGINKLVNIADDRYINLTGKQSLQRIASIINNSFFFIGVDSGFAHMANALQKNGLVLIGQYKVDKTVFNRYNPFTGMYASADAILYADDNTVSTIPCEKVTARLAQKLQLAPQL